MKKSLIYFSRVCSVFLQAIMNFIAHGGLEYAGYMAFITLLSFFPFIIFLITVAGFMGKTDHSIGFVKSLIEFMPAEIASTLQPRVNEIISGPSRSLITFSVLSCIWTSSSAVEGLRTIFNKIYHVVAPPNYLIRRMLSILLFFIIIALIIASTFILFFLPIILDQFSHLDHYFHVNKIINTVNVSSFAVLSQNLRDLTYLITLFFSMMFVYYTIPNISVSFKSLIPGSIIAVILFVLTAKLLTFYVYNFAQVNLVYGSLAGIVVTMLFFYIINIIIIFGAEINYLLQKI